jgi:hypothetical protein
MLEKHLQTFAKLRTDRGRDRHPAITYHRAPHKPFLLLSIIDLIVQGKVTENLIEPSFELVDTIRGTLLNGVTRQGYAKRLIGRALVRAGSPLRRGVSFSQFLIDKLPNHSYILTRIMVN